MNSCRDALLVLSLVIAPIAAHAQAAPTSRGTVVFVCEHGTVKSLLAKVLFEQYAQEAGLSMQALSRGTRADSVVPPWMLKGLAGDGVALGAWRPQTLGAGDLAGASLVVLLDVPMTTVEGISVSHTQWDSLPSVSRDYAAGRDAIKARVRQLVDSLRRVPPKRD